MKHWMLTLVCAAGFASAGSAGAQGGAGTATASEASAPTAGSTGFDQQFQAARDLAISGRREQAVAAYTALLESSPGNSDVLLGRGRVYAWMGRWAEAEADLRAATVASPRYADAWSALGDLYRWSDRPAQAVEAYSQWLALGRADDPAPLVARGRAYRAAGDIASARADFLAAGARGADRTQVEEYLASLTPRALSPGALSPDAVVPATYLWSASLGASWTGFSPSRSDWTEFSLSVRRHFVSGSLAVEALGADRFGMSDHAWALDGYVDLWSRAYANLRFQQGPNEDLYPGTAWRAELFQGVGHGWEVSASYDRLNFGTSNVDLYGLGVGKYIGNWYLRLRHLYVPSDNSDSHSDRLLVRYYYAGDADNYVELTAGAGRSDATVPGVPGASGNTRSWSAGAAYVKFLNTRCGFRLGAGFDHGDDGYNGRGLSATAYTRW
jgi:YaiO family outer membrane protein